MYSVLARLLRGRGESALAEQGVVKIIQEDYAFGVPRIELGALGDPVPMASRLLVLEFLSADLPQLREVVGQRLQPRLGP